LLVYSCVSIETRRVIYLDHPRLQLRIQHNVEAQKFEAAVGILRLARPVNVLELRLNTQNGFNNDLLNLNPNVVSTPLRRRLAWLDCRHGHLAFETVTDL
jgi:hypothetical protein